MSRNGSNEVLQEQYNAALQKSLWKKINLWCLSVFTKWYKGGFEFGNCNDRELKIKVKLKYLSYWANSMQNFNMQNEYAIALRRDLESSNHLLFYVVTFEAIFPQKLAIPI